MTAAKKILLGMSGGIDSTVATKILLDQGYEVAGATFIFFLPDHIEPPGQAARDAAEICKRLGIRHFVLDMREEFASNVITPFIDTYLAGGTPNPCVECNRTSKFPGLFRKADELGFEYVATGHYARTAVDDDTGRHLLLTGLDGKKDQSYVLYNLKQDELARTRFPLGTLTKPEVRAMAERFGFSTQVEKAESQDICFIPDSDYPSFIEARRPGRITPGDFISRNGDVVGRHKGMACYTIGQRRGIACAFGRPMYVAAKNPRTNTVTLAEENALFSKELKAEKINLISMAEIIPGATVSVKTRYSHNSKPAKLYPDEHDENAVRIVFDEPQRALTIGQSAVFYDGEKVAGGGVITQVR